MLLKNTLSKGIINLNLLLDINQTIAIIELAQCFDLMVCSITEIIIKLKHFLSKIDQAGYFDHAQAPFSGKQMHKNTYIIIKQSNTHNAVQYNTTTRSFIFNYLNL